MSKIKVHIGESLKDWLESNGEYEKFEHIMNNEAYDILRIHFFDWCPFESDVYHLCFCNDSDLESAAEYIDCPNEVLINSFTFSSNADAAYIRNKCTGAKVVVMYIPKYEPGQEADKLAQTISDLIKKVKLLFK